MNLNTGSGVSLDDKLNKNEPDTTNFDEIKTVNYNGLSEKERKLERLQEEDRRKYKDEGLKKLNIIEKDIVERDPKDLHPHEVNVVLYDHEEVDPTLVDSIIKKGQLEPIVITKDTKTDKEIIISGHRRWLALKYINENKKQSINLKEGSVRDYDKDNPLPFVEMRARCVVVNLPTEESRILAIIDYNKRRKKRWSQYFNEIRVLHSIYDPEALRNRNIHLKQYAVSTDLKERYPKEKDSTLNDEQYYGKLYEEGIITDEDVKNSNEYKKAYKRDNKGTLELISDEIGLGRTNVSKLTSIGNLALEKKDKAAIDIMECLDFFNWSLNNAYNVYKLKYFQTKFKEDSDSYKELDQRINNVLTASKKQDKNAKKKIDIVTDKEVQKYQDIVNELERKGKEKKKEKDKFSVILIEPEDNTEITEKFEISNSSNSALFVIATHNNLAGCMKLMTTKLKYTYRTFCFFEDKLLLLGTRDKLPPEEMTEKIENRSELYVKIREYYPNENYHELLNSNTPKEKPIGWEIPLGKSVSNKQAKESEKKIKEAKKQPKASKKKVNSKKKSSNSTSTSDFSTNNNNEPIGV